MVIAALGHRVGRVLGSVVARGRDPTEAALALLEGMPLEGRMVTLDVGWMTQPVVRKEVEKGGGDLVPIQREVLEGQRGR